jgi:large subunit ribosomal protein LP2
MYDQTLLESVGIEADESRLETLISELKGKDINEVCRDWRLDLSSLPDKSSHSSSPRILPSP